MRRLTILLVPLLLLATGTAAAPGFGPPVTLARGVTLYYGAPVTLATSDDYAYAAWENSGSANGDIFFRRLHADRSTAGGIHRISSAPTESTQPALLANGDDVMLAWTEVETIAGGPVGGRVFVRRSPDGGATWKPAVVIAQMNRGVIAASPRMASHGGTLAVVYGKRHSIWLRTSRDAGETWTAPRQVNAPGGWASDPDVYMDDQGLYVTYVVGAPDGYLFFRRTVDYMNWQSPIQFGRGLPATIGGHGQAIVVAWARRGGDGRPGSIFARRSLNHGGAFGAARVVAEDLGEVYEVSLSGAGGGVAVAWSAPDGLWVSMSADGGDWGTPARIEPRAQHPYGPVLTGGERFWLGYYRRGERFRDVVVRRGE